MSCKDTSILFAAEFQFGTKPQIRYFVFKEHKLGHEPQPQAPVIITGFYTSLQYV